MKMVLLTIAFFEGLVVLSVEIISAKIMAPIYGTTTYVWTAIIAITLGGLALGYLAGSKFAVKMRGHILITSLSLLAAGFIFFLPVIVSGTEFLFSGSSIRVQPLFSATLSILPIMICLGAIEPVLIQHGAPKANNAGNFSGKVFAFSTVGGLAIIYIVSYWMIPEIGISGSLTILSLLLMVVAGVSFFGLNFYTNAHSSGVK